MASEDTEYDMAGMQISRLFSFLKTTEGVLTAAPIVLGVAFILTTLDTGSSAAENASKQATAAAVGTKTTAAPAPTASSEASKVAEKPAQSTPAASVKKVADAGSDATKFSSALRDEIGKIVKEYLLANPRILVEMSEKLQKIQQEEQSRQREQVLSSSKQSIFRSPVDYALGDKDADVTIVEYFDYNCGWCKRALNEVTKLTESDSNLRRACGIRRSCCSGLLSTR